MYTTVQSTIDDMYVVLAFGLFLFLGVLRFSRAFGRREWRFALGALACIAVAVGARFADKPLCHPSSWRKRAPEEVQTGSCTDVPQCVKLKPAEVDLPKMVTSDL
jgi:hypothetical protein